MKTEFEILRNTSIFFLKLALAFWFIETAIFLIIDGWHIYPIRKEEIECDKIANNFFKVFYYLMIYAFLTNFKKKENEN